MSADPVKQLVDFLISRAPGDHMETIHQIGERWPKLSLEQLDRGMGIATELLRLRIADNQLDLDRLYAEVASLFPELDIGSVDCASVARAIAEFSEAGGESEKLLRHIYGLFPTLSETDLRRALAIYIEVVAADVAEAKQITRRRKA